MSKDKPPQHIGHHRHKAETHLSDKRSPDSGQRESSVLPRVENPEGETLSCLVHLNSDEAWVTLRAITGPGQRLLHIRAAAPEGVKISNVNEITQLIDALYAVGAAWQKQDQQKGESHGDK